MSRDESVLSSNGDLLFDIKKIVLIKTSSRYAIKISMGVYGDQWVKFNGIDRFGNKIDADRIYFEHITTLGESSSMCNMSSYATSDLDIAKEKYTKLIEAFAIKEVLCSYEKFKIKRKLVKHRSIIQRKT